MIIVEQSFVATENIKHIELIRFSGKLHILVLGMNVDQMFGKLAQQRQRDGRVVDKSTAAATGKQLAAQQTFTLHRIVEIVVFDNSLHIRGVAQEENSLDH